MKMQGDHTLVTGGYDGLIVVWNTDSGAISAHMTPPSLSHTGLQDRTVEQVSTTLLDPAYVTLVLLSK